MKKLIATISILSMLFMTSCSNDGDSQAVDSQYEFMTVSLKDKATQLAIDIGMLAGDEFYSQMFSTDPDIASILDAISAQDFSTPTNIYKIGDINNAYINAFSYMGKELPTFENPRIEEILKHRLITSIPQQVNGYNGVNMLSATSLLIADDVFLYPDLTETEAYLLLYDGDYNICVIFTPRNDIVQADASIINNYMLNQIQKNGLDDETKLEISLLGLSLEEITN